MMKRIIFVLCEILMIICLLIPFISVNALGVNCQEPEITVSEGEAETTCNLLEQNGFGGENTKTDVLFDSKNKPSYLLGVSENGYIIVERDSFRFCECGDGNPYSGFENKIKYYGGPLCYYASVEAEKENVEMEYYNIVRGENCDKISTIIREGERKNQDTLEEKDTASSMPAVTLPNNYSYIRRKAFGYNDDNTCSAVATGIAINYIALQENMKIIPNNRLPETMDDGNPGNLGDLLQKYPRAYLLHRYIADTAGMGPASFDQGIVDGVSYYVDHRVKELLDFSDDYAYDLELTLLVGPSSSTIRASIQEGKPMLISTIFAGEYSFHTMCVYGHRVENDEDQLLVHTGWNSKNSVVESGTEMYKQNLIWIDEGYAVWGYYFTYENPLSEFYDIPDFTDYTYNGILYCVHNGIMQGTSQHTFNPNGTLTRGMFVTTMYRMAGSPSVTGYNNPFTDVYSNRYYYKAVLWAYHYGLINGITQTQFAPDNSLERQQLATIFYRYAQYEGRDTSNLSNTSSIPDWSQVSNYAKTAVRWAVAEEILVPVPGNNGNYLPRSNASRGQTAYAVYQYGR